MLHRMGTPLLVIVAASFLTVMAQAADIAPAANPQVVKPFTFFDEFTVGAFGHDSMRPTEGNTYDASFEVFTSPLFGNHNPTDVFGQLINPRLNLGVVINDDNRTSFAYLGPAWRVDLIGPVFADGEFGMAVNNGMINGDATHLAVGSNITFHEEIGLGYRVTNNIDLILTAEHISHAGWFGKHNSGVSDLGVRIGYRF